MELRTGIYVLETHRVWQEVFRQASGCAVGYCVGWDSVERTKHQGEETDHRLSSLHGNTNG